VEYKWFGVDSKKRGKGRGFNFGFRIVGTIKDMEENLALLTCF